MKLTCLPNEAAHVGTSAPLESCEVRQEANFKLCIENYISFLSSELPHGRCVGALGRQFDSITLLGLCLGRPLEIDNMRSPN